MPRERRERRRGRRLERRREQAACGRRCGLRRRRRRGRRSGRRRASVWPRAAARHRAPARFACVLPYRPPRVCAVSTEHVASRPPRVSAVSTTHVASCCCAPSCRCVPRMHWLNGLASRKIRSTKVLPADNSANRKQHARVAQRQQARCILAAHCEKRSVERATAAADGGDNSGDRDPLAAEIKAGCSGSVTGRKARRHATERPGKAAAGGERADPGRRTSVARLGQYVV